MQLNRGLLTSSPPYPKRCRDSKESSISLMKFALRNVANIHNISSEKVSATVSFEVNQQTSDLEITIDSPSESWARNTHNVIHRAFVHPPLAYTIRMTGFV